MNTHESIVLAMVPSNNEIKKVRSLQQKKFRDEYGLFAVEGEKMVREALGSSFDVEAVYYRDEIGEENMRKISSLTSPSPALAVVRKPEHVYPDTPSAYRSLFGTAGLYIGLDSIRDPGNLGTILRIADWFGVDGVFATADTVDVFNPKTVQSTMGAIFRVRMHYVDLPELSKQMIEAGGKVYGTFLDGMNIYERDLDTGGNSPVMVVTGNESEGISHAMEEIVSDRLYLPPFPVGEPGSESLNAAIATALSIAEFRRRMNIKK